MVVDLDHPLLANKTGRGIAVAVIDSGVHATHPHIGSVAGGVGLTVDGAEHQDFVDRIGHGTAVTAAIKEKAPDAAIHAVKVFDQTLATNARVLAHAIEWASRSGARLINLSLGTANRRHAEILEQAVEVAKEQGALIVSARESDGALWLPGSLESVVGVVLDWECPRNAFRVDAAGAGRCHFSASGYPRPIPGVDPSRNLQGISFAVANVTGCLARLLQAHPQVRTVQSVADALSGYQ